MPRAGRRAGPDPARSPPCSRGPADQPGARGAEAPLRSRRCRARPPQDTLGLARPPLPSPPPQPRRRPRRPHGPNVPNVPPVPPRQRPGLQPHSCSPSSAAARAPATPASAAPASRNEPCGPQPGVRRGRALRRTEGAHCSNRQEAGPRARRSSPVGQEAWRHWSEARRGGVTHVGPKSAKLGRAALTPASLPWGLGRSRTPVSQCGSPLLSASPLSRTVQVPIPSSNPHQHRDPICRAGNCGSERPSDTPRKWPSRKLRATGKKRLHKNVKCKIFAGQKYQS